MPPLSPGFFYPLSLGQVVVARREDKRGDKSEAPPPLEFPFYIEDSEHWRKSFQQQPEAQVLESWLRSPNVYALVGEPGGGKTTLLKHWAVTLAQRTIAQASKSGGEQFVPLYIPLRDIKDGTPKDYVRRSISDLGLNLEPYLSTTSPIPVVWLIDGWDELPSDLKQTWKQYIQGLPGVRIVSCRTAVYDREFGEPRYVMGLNDTAQRSFLCSLAEVWRERHDLPAFSQANEAWVDRLHSTLQKHPQLRRLAGSPLLLTLIALTNPPTDTVKLPQDRVAFYRQAFDGLFKNRVALEEYDTRPEVAKKLLRQVANKVGLEPNFPKDILWKAYEDLDLGGMAKSPEQYQLLMHAIHEAGIIQLRGPQRLLAEFLHLTFQEFFLAEALLEREGLQQALQEHWRNPRYEETLGLLWAMAESEERHQGTVYLIKQGCQDAQGQSFQTPKKRSGLRTALHLWSKSGLSLEAHPETMALLQRQLKRRNWRFQRVLVLILTLIGDVYWRSYAAANDYDSF
jgi:predicted NACHT family NTPase